MAEMRTEEEQVEALKNWWKENGKSLVYSIAIAVAAVFGWRAWQANQENYAASASALYESLSTTASAGVAVDEAQFASMKHLAEQLKSDYQDSGYAPMAAMLLAGVMVNQGELDMALSELDFVAASEESTANLKRLAQLRQVQIYLAKQELVTASQLLSAAGEGVYDAFYLELKGDLAFAEGDRAAAREAYSAAMDQADPQTRSLIQMKFDDLAQGDA